MGVGYRLAKFMQEPLEVLLDGLLTMEAGRVIEPRLFLSEAPGDADVGLGLAHPFGGAFLHGERGPYRPLPAGTNRPLPAGSERRPACERSDQAGRDASWRGGC